MSLDTVMKDLSAAALRVKKERDEAIRLLREAETNLRHRECINEDAMRCAGCGLEAEIHSFLKRAAS